MIPLYKEDCKWYDYWQDMSARIPFCKAGKNMDASGFFLETCDGCKDYGNKNVITNADRIRGKDDDGLAEFIYSEMFLTPWCDMSCGDVEEFPCRQCMLKWLKQEAKT